jgi:hypothetical protein
MSEGYLTDTSGAKILCAGQVAPNKRNKKEEETRKSGP